MLPTAKNTESVNSTSLHMKVKIPNLPKPFVPSKPILATKPSTVISHTSFPLDKPVVSRPRITQVLPILTDQSSVTLDTVVVSEVLKSNNMNSSKDSNTKVDSEYSSPRLSDIYVENDYNEHSLSNTENISLQYNKTENSVHSLIAAPNSIAWFSSVSTSCSNINTLKTSSIPKLLNVDCGDKKNIVSSSCISSEENIARSNIVNTGKPVSEKRIHAALKVHAQNQVFVNKVTHVDLDFDTTTNLSVDIPDASCHHQVQTPSAIVNNKRLPSAAFAEALSSKLKGPNPLSMGKKSQSVFHVPLMSTTAEPEIMTLPNRSAVKVQQNNSLDMSTSVQQTSFPGQSFQQQPRIPTSFQSVPKRPPPRPADFILSRTENLFVVSPEGQLEKSRLLVAQHAVDEEKRKYEEEKQREEEKKQREEAERMREIDRKIAVEKKERKRNQRTKVIEEIVNSEKDYLFNLHLCLETFSDRQKPPAGVDLEFLLGNMEEIADVSQKIVISLETSISEADLEKQCVGQCFINFAEDMKNTYAPYCRNHDEVITAMEKYSDSPEISAYFNSKIEAMKKQTNVFDMASILIRPVQRILKYPLLLNELLKNTEEDHPDREDTKAAIKEMTNVAMAINEYKRRKDLVYKYKNFTDQTFSDKISKLNLHSIMKKSTRMKGRLSANLGIALQMRDEMFEKEETKFRHLERTIRVFLDSIQQYLDQSQETMRSHTVYIDYIKDFYKDKEYAEAIKLYEVTYKQLSLFDNMKATVEHNVVIPLNILSGLFAAPTKIIEKRYDKMLDYNYQLGKEENDKELQAAKNDYEAMNYQLLDELPKFYNLAYKMLRHCISVFILARRDFMDQSLKESCTLLELPSMASKTNLMDTFRIRHTTVFDHMSMLSFIPKGFNPRVDIVKADRVKQKGCSAADNSLRREKSLQSSTNFQNENRVKYLYQSYPPDKLYWVISTYNAVDLMDISVTEGCLIGVVKEHDPMDNKEKWFVDDGGSKGFIPHNILTPLNNSPWGTIGNEDEEDDIISILSGDSGDSIVLTGNDNRVESHSSNSFTDSSYQQTYQPQYQYYYALYDFQSRHSNEASLTAGHPVAVLKFHDADGRTEWWLVDSEGKRGYAPANYMAPYEAPSNNS